ncbi:MAG: MFS transporter [Bryobacteraceae bacterium]
MGSTGRRFGAAFWVVVISAFLGFLGVGAVVPVLAPHVRNDLHQSDFVLGLIIGVFSFTALASRFLSGPITDRYGRKYSFMAGLALCALSGAMYLLPMGVGGIFGGRVLHGIGEAFLFAGAGTWVVELGDPTRRARSLTFLSTGIWGGISIGPVVGQFLGTFDRAAWLLLLSPIPAIAAVSMLPETYSFRAVHGKRAWIPREAVGPGIILGLVNMHHPALAGFVVLHLADRANSGGTAFSAYAAMVLLSRFFLGGLPDRMSSRTIFRSGSSVMLVGLLVLALKPPAAIAILAAAMIGFGFSFPWPSVAAFVLQRIDDSRRASGMGVLTAFADLFLGLGSLLAGAVASRFGYPWIYVTSAVMVVAAMALAERVLAEPLPLAGTPETVVQR